MTNQGILSALHHYPVTLSRAQLGVGVASCTCSDERTIARVGTDDIVSLLGVPVVSYDVLMLPNSQPTFPISCPYFPVYNEEISTLRS